MQQRDSAQNAAETRVQFRWWVGGCGSLRDHDTELTAERQVGERTHFHSLQVICSRDWKKRQLAEVETVQET